GGRGRWPRARAGLRRVRTARWAVRLAGRGRRGRAGLAGAGHGQRRAVPGRGQRRAAAPGRGHGAPDGVPGFRVRPAPARPRRPAGGAHRSPVRVVPRLRGRLRAGRRLGAAALGRGRRGAGGPGPAGRGHAPGRGRPGGRGGAGRDRGVRAGSRAAAPRRLRARAAAPRPPELMAAPLRPPTGIPAQAYARRRRQLMRMAGEDAILVLPAAPERIRSRDTFFPYRQDSDLWYLTGFPEPEAVLVLVPGRRHGEALLFCRERDPEREGWDGPRAGPEGAVEAYGMDDAYPIDDLDEILPGLLEGRTRVYYHFGRDTEFDLKLIGWLNRVRAQVRLGAQPPHEFLEL